MTSNGIHSPKATLTTEPQASGAPDIFPASSNNVSVLPSSRWIWQRALNDTRSTTFLFLFLFLLVMPIALLVIGKEGYLLLSENLKTAWPGYPFLEGMSTVLIVFHFFIALLSNAAVIILVNLHFRFLYKMPSSDTWFSAPFTRTQHFVGRFAATITSLLVIYLGNAIATFSVLFAWKEQSMIRQYFPLYVITFLSSCVLAAFSSVIHGLSGRLFDANVFNISFQAAWVISLVIMMQPLNIGRPYFRKQLIFSMAPIADTFYVAFAKPSVWMRLILALIFWTFAGVMVMRRRQAENAEVRIGRFKWHSAVQPLFSLFIGLLFGDFLEMLFATYNYSFRKHTALFYIGLVIGAFLGQLVSSSISGKTLRRGFRRLPTAVSAPSPPVMPWADIVQEKEVPATGSGATNQNTPLEKDLIGAPKSEAHLPIQYDDTGMPQTDILRPTSTQSYNDTGTPQTDILRPTSTQSYNDTGRRRIPWLLREWVQSLAGVAFYFLIDAISRSGYFF